MADSIEDRANTAEKNADDAKFGFKMGEAAVASKLFEDAYQESSVRGGPPGTPGWHHHGHVIDQGPIIINHPKSSIDVSPPGHVISKQK